MILNNADLVTFWDSEPFVKGVLVAIEGKIIVDFGSIGKLADRYDDSDTLDVGGRMVMPGLINAHTHLRRTLTRGMPIKGGPPRTFQEMQEAFCWKPDRSLCEEGVYLGTLIGLLDSVRAGVTTVVDHHSSPAVVPGCLDAVWQAFSEVGVRGALSYAVSDRDGSRVSRAGIDENRRFIKRCKAEGSEMMSGLFGLEASHAVSRPTLEQVVAAHGEVGGCFHVHVAEDRGDLEVTRREHGATPVERLVAGGVLKKGSLAVHCVHLEEADYRQLRASGVRAVGCRGRGHRRSNPSPGSGNSYHGGHRWGDRQRARGVPSDCPYSARDGACFFGSQAGGVSVDVLGQRLAGHRALRPDPRKDQARGAGRPGGVGPSTGNAAHG